MYRLRASGGRLSGEPIMKVRTFAGFILAGICASALALWLFVPAPAMHRLPEVTHDGLRRVHKSKFAVAYVKPGADLDRYDKFIILEPSVSFKKGWQRAHPQMRAVEMKRVGESFARNFLKAFTKELEEKAGYVVVDQPAEDVLMLKPTVVDLDVTASKQPGSNSVTRYTASSGSTILYLEVYNAVSGEVLARVLDRNIAGDGMISSLPMPKQARSTP